MQPNKNSLFAAIAAQRIILLELILTAIIIALGVNFLSDGISEYFAFPPFTSILLGFALLVLPICYLLGVLFLRATRFSRSYEAVFLPDTETENLVFIERYEYSTKLKQYFDALFAENKAYEAMWLRGRQDFTKGHIFVKGQEGQQMIKEASEYFLLYLLSSHLTFYFDNLIDNKDFKKGTLKRFERRDMPEILVTNRFLDQFSKSTRERASFVEDNNYIDTDTVMEENGLLMTPMLAASASGSLFERFELVLPRNSKITREKNGSITIASANLILNVHILFPGFATIVPKEYLQYHFQHPTSIIPFALTVNLSATLKPLALFNTDGWKYYRWLDSLLDDINNKLSIEAFFKRINWEQLAIMLKITQVEAMGGEIMDNTSKDKEAAN